MRAKRETVRPWYDIDWLWRATEVTWCGRLKRVRMRWRGDVMESRDRWMASRCPTARGCSADDLLLSSHDDRHPTTAFHSASEVFALCTTNPLVDSEFESLRLVGRRTL